VTGYSTKDKNEEDIKTLFAKYGEISEFSWKGRFCFIVIMRLFILGIFKS
jgi:arginine/serine-rich splicing factor 7